MNAVLYSAMKFHLGALKLKILIFQVPSIIFRYTSCMITANLTCMSWLTSCSHVALYATFLI